jgi:hypothetical protein
VPARHADRASAVEPIRLELAWKWQLSRKNAGNDHLMAHRISRGVGLVLGVMVSVACGNGDDLDPYAGFDGTFEPIEILPARPYPPRPASPSRDELPSSSPPAPADGAGEDENPPVDPGGDGVGVDEAPAVDPDVCVTPPGVSGAPRSIPEAMTLLNSLPKPVSLACFLQALSRPLSLYMTRSNRSLQPAPAARSPRTFIVYEPLVMSIVLDGPASATLELGYRTSPSRSVKTEFHFPLETNVTNDNLFDEVSLGRLTKCGACHTAEIITVRPDLPVEVFESDIIEPFEIYEVELDELRAERSSCDVVDEPARCALLSALFDQGEVRAAPGGILF